jgi:hypothetical protein
VLADRDLVYLRATVLLLADFVVQNQWRQLLGVF